MPEHLLDLAVMLRAEADPEEQVLLSRLALGNWHESEMVAES